MRDMWFILVLLVSCLIPSNAWSSSAWSSESSESESWSFKSWFSNFWQSTKPKPSIDSESSKSFKSESPPKSKSSGCNDCENVNYLECKDEENRAHQVCDCKDNEPCYIKFNVIVDPSNPSKFQINKGKIGPIIIAKFNTTIVVDVHNNIKNASLVPINGENVTNEDLSIHWHGMHQRGAPWMDGIGWVTQYPIRPRERFRYIFRAYPSGTHWYHSHMRKQRDQGIFGALIVKEEEKKCINGAQHPYGEEEIIDKPELTTIAITEELTKIPNGTEGYPTNPDGSAQPEGDIEVKDFLINGIRLDQIPKKPEEGSNSTFFNVTSGNSYRFRIIGSMEETVLRFSIDGHKLHVMAADGYLTEKFETDVIHVHVGERYDFILEAIRSDGNTIFPIRIESVGFNHTTHLSERVGIAYLRYDNGLSNQHLLDCSKQCILGNTNFREEFCNALNCPFQEYHLIDNAPYYKCQHLSNLKLLYPTPEEHIPDEDPSVEYFLNFDFRRNYNTSLWHTINGIRFKLPSNVPFEQGDPPLKNSSIPDECKYNQTNSTCKDDVNICPYAMYIHNGSKTVQIVLSAINDDEKEKTKKIANIRTHPIHLHGHTFTVAKIAYPNYYDNNGTIKDVNPDVFVPNCRHGKWSGNYTERNFSVNATTLRKDVIIVPAGGYVVIKFKANNPGWWLLHCHIDPHLLNGMAIAVGELPECSQNPPQAMMKKSDDVCISVDEWKKSQKEANNKLGNCGLKVYDQAAAIKIRRDEFRGWINSGNNWVKK